MAYVRYQTVRNIFVGVLVGGGITAGIVAQSSKPEPPPTPVALSAPPTPAPARTPTPTPEPARTPEPAPTPEPTPAATPTPTPTSSEPYATQLAAVADVILHQRATSPKIKDFFRGNGPKVNIYDDDKDGQWDRAKVDFNRDEVDDEKLTFKAGTLERKSETTGETRVWDNGSWRLKSP